MAQQVPDAHPHQQVTGEELAKTFDEVQTVDLSYVATEDWITLALFWLMALCVFLQFFTRYVLNNSFAWTEEIATNCLVAIVFLGASMCVRLSRHIQVDFLYRYLSEKTAFAMSTLVDLIRIYFFVYALKITYIYIALVGEEQMTTIQVAKGWFYWLVFAGFVLMLIRSIQVAVENWRRGYSILTRPGAFDGSEAL